MTLCSQVWSTFGLVMETTLDSLLISFWNHLWPSIRSWIYNSVVQHIFWKAVKTSRSCHLLYSFLNAQEYKSFLQYRLITTHIFCTGDLERFRVSFSWEGGEISLAFLPIRVWCLIVPASLSSERDKSRLRVHSWNFYQQLAATSCTGASQEGSFCRTLSIR